MRRWGYEMDEGGCVAYADRVTEGAVPHRDFLTYYGPGNPWLVAGAFEIFGTSILTERLVGLAVPTPDRALAVRDSDGGSAELISGILAGLVAASIMAYEPTGPPRSTGRSRSVCSARSSWPQVSAPRPATAIASARGRSGRRHRCADALRVRGSGLASAIPLLLLAASRSRLWYAGGFLALAGLYVPHLLLVGSDRIEHVLGDVVATVRAAPCPFRGRGIRRETCSRVPLQLPASSCSWASRSCVRRRSDVTGRLLVAVGVFNILLLPWALSRADVAHFRPLSIIPFSLLPALAMLVVTHLRIGTTARRVAAALTCLVVATIVVVRADFEPRESSEHRSLRSLLLRQEGRR